MALGAGNASCGRARQPPARRCVNIRDMREAFDFNFAFLLDETGPIFHVPAEGAEEGIEEIVAELRFGVAGLFQFGEASAKRFHQPIQF
jgi:hypothetical protein